MTNPYSYKLTKYNWVVGKIYELRYDNCSVRKLFGYSKEEVEDLVFLLNVAFNEGLNQRYSLPCDE